MSFRHNLPIIGHWWEYRSVLLEHSFRVQFQIRDIVIRQPFENSWVIYSNDDDEDFFVARMEEFVRENSNWSFYKEELQ